VTPQSAEFERIVLANAPVLCLDTCSLLDLVRDPSRESSLPHDAAASMELLQAVESWPRVVALVADQVRAELGQHLSEVVDEANRGLRKLRAHVQRVDGLVSAFGAAVRTDLSPWDRHVTTAADAVERWIRTSTVAPQSVSVQHLAYSRVMTARAPARKGKDSLQDCVVLETYLEFVGELRRRGLTADVVFLSSNTSDYSESSTRRSQLHPGLVAEFAALNVGYATGYGMARGMLGL
jgi:PIN domain